MYGKHFETMYTGSMRGSGAVTFAVWGYIIAHVKPPSYELELNPEVVGFLIGEPEQSIAATIERFCQPDPKSRSQEHEGRKLIKRGTYLYFVVNGESYHQIRNEEEKRAYWRKQKQIQRHGKPESPEPKSNGYHKDARTVLHMLNEACNKRFREVDANLAVISARLNEPDVDLAGVEEMILRQCRKWHGTDMEEYLRPETLFGKTKFDGYYAARSEPILPKNKPPLENQI